MTWQELIYKLEEGNIFHHPGYNFYQLSAGQFMVHDKKGKRAYLDLYLMKSDKWILHPTKFISSLDKPFEEK